MSSRLVRRAYREMAEPERVAWARMMARHCQVAIRRKQRFTVVVTEVRDGKR